MDDVYDYLYDQYESVYHALAPCNHKQIDKILKACDADEDEEVVLEAMHSCVGCSGSSVPALGD